MENKMNLKLKLKNDQNSQMASTKETTSTSLIDEKPIKINLKLRKKISESTNNQPEQMSNFENVTKDNIIKKRQKIILNENHTEYPPIHTQSKIIEKNDQLQAKLFDEREHHGNENTVIRKKKLHQEIINTTEKNTIIRKKKTSVESTSKCQTQSNDKNKINSVIKKNSKLKKKQCEAERGLNKKQCDAEQKINDTVVINSKKNEKIIVDPKKNEKVIVDSKKSEKISIDSKKKEKIIVDSKKNEKIIVGSKKNEKIIVDSKKSDKINRDSKKNQRNTNRSIAFKSVKKFDPHEENIRQIKVDFSDWTDLPQIEGGGGIVAECLQLIKRNDPHSELSKEELAEKVEYQKDLLIKNKSKYTESDFSVKMIAIEKVLSKLTLGLTFENLNKMTDNRKKIDKIVLDKKIPKEQFKKKIDLSGKCHEPDPSYQIITDSRKYFEKLGYLKPPPNIVFPQNKGNQPIPPEVLNKLNFGR